MEDQRSDLWTRMTDPVSTHSAIFKLVRPAIEMALVALCRRGSHSLDSLRMSRYSLRHCLLSYIACVSPRGFAVRDRAAVRCVGTRWETRDAVPSAVLETARVVRRRETLGAVASCAACSGLNRSGVGIRYVRRFNCACGSQSGGGVVELHQTQPPSIHRRRNSSCVALESS